LLADNDLMGIRFPPLNVLQLCFLYCKPNQIKQGLAPGREGVA